MAKAKKPRKEHYEPKVKTDKTWIELIDKSVTYNPKKKPEAGKK
jgi:hypothetical protein